MAESSKKDLNMSINLDNTPILYTDGIQMTANEDGVVLNVLQRVGNTGQQRVVARIGMSLTHGKKVADLLARVVANPTGMSETRAIKAD